MICTVCTVDYAPASAALRGGIRTVLIPDENRKDLADIPKTVTDRMKIVPVRWIDQVLEVALDQPKGKKRK